MTWRHKDNDYLVYTEGLIEVGASWYRRKGLLTRTVKFNYQHCSIGFGRQSWHRTTCQVMPKRSNFPKIYLSSLTCRKPSTASFGEVSLGTHKARNLSTKYSFRLRDSLTFWPSKSFNLLSLFLLKCKMKTLIIYSERWEDIMNEQAW